MDTLDLQQIRELAQKRQQEDLLISKLPELERQAASELAMTKAAFEADVLASQFEAQAETYQIKLGDMQTKLVGIFAELDNLKADLDSLAVESKQVADSAYNLADKRTRAGFYAGLAKQMGLSRYDKPFVEGQAGEIIKQKFGQSELLFGFKLAGSESDLATWLLAALSQLTGLKAVKPNQPAILPMPEDYRLGRTR